MSYHIFLEFVIAIHSDKPFSIHMLLLNSFDTKWQLIDNIICINYVITNDKKA